MKYESPEMTVMTPAMSAIQGGVSSKAINDTYFDSTVGDLNESSSTFVDWE
jgi:hypothetical protein